MCPIGEPGSHRPRVLAGRTWRSEELESIERFQLVETPTGHLLAGETQITRHYEPVRIRYEVEVDAGWRTTSARIRIPDLDLDLDITVDGEAKWSVNDRHLADLDDCVDIDLGWTPATNTLPIRRSRSGIEIPFTTRAAWLQWPELWFSPANQTYVKRTDHRWTYVHRDFSADLTVDDQCVVITYGEPPIWQS